MYNKRRRPPHRPALPCPAPLTIFMLVRIFFLFYSYFNKIFMHDGHLILLLLLTDQQYTNEQQQQQQQNSLLL
jgi:hypothetical protein